MIARRLSIAALFVMLAPTPAFAVLCGTFLSPVSVNISGLAFGNYFPLQTSTNSMTVSVSCALLNGTDVLPAFTVSLSSGNAGSPASRYMDSAGTRLNYNIYTSQAYSKVWGDGTSASLTQSYNGLLSLGSTSFTGYGRLPAGQYVATGGYSDLITVTVAY